ncbi:tetratricopeptide repeat protein [Mycobacteroides franklinii]|uniref:NB-ARC domain-containing protein n=1 Tax=Mycobacteroides franklinii TaxID=948102 RepID=A0A4R8R3W1_9MYCO|nr:tetratricopeptide repeat protein [Mycobacteroides franklinii]TDZ45728.1 hypothetical protein CCUG64054_01378 [Mycobacteroides franklinii]TDZ49218.1 hypothetical protein CCUG63697_03754 [Mycobacteroides franklinii]TDZ59398.1 hypothetical protein CCUG63696_01380 [Mycobacteroides franklinii]TDZ66913.1 hypothetical protein CCUG63695_00743 [Mycobacteroides franklinii]TDZ72837.1 hypothetical protein CCUG64056_01378 [Mycobacteroides franklinii]
MSGRNCAFGLYFQYLVSLSFLLDVLEKPDHFRLRIDPSDSGDNGPDCNLQIVDFEVAQGGTRTVVAQVKGAIDPETASRITAPDLASWFRDLVASGPSESYQVVTNRGLTDRAQRIADALEAGDAQALQQAWPDKFDSDFQNDTFAHLLLRCRVVREHRGTTELLSGLRARIRKLRIRMRAGTGDESAGLLTIYLVGQLFYHGSGAHRDLVTVDQAREWLRISPADLAHSIRRYDWGIPIGVPFPGKTIRTSKLGDLARFFDDTQPDPRASRLAVVHGLSGLGKSTLSAQYACTYADHYDFMWWVDCESESSIEHSLERLASTIPLLEWGIDGPSLADLPAALSKFPGRWLIVADNVYNEEIVAPWLPTVGCGDIIVTTFNKTLWPLEYHVDLTGGFDENESERFLHERLPALRDDKDLLRDLAEVLEHWPLALAMAVAYLINAQRDLRGTPRDDLERFRSAVIRTTSAVDKHKYPRTLAAAISLVLQQVMQRAELHPDIGRHDVGELAIGGLAASCYCAESDIPAEVLWPSVIATGNTDDRAEQAAALDAVITLLRSGSLVQRSNLLHELPRGNPFRDRITVNRITQDVIRSEFEARYSRAVMAQFLVEVCMRVDQFLQPAVQNSQFSTIAALSNHAECVVLQGKRLDSLSPQMAALHGNLALAFEKRGRFNDAIALLEDELVMLDRLTDTTSLMKIKTLIQLSHALVQAGRTFDEILARITQTVEVLECFEPASDRQKGELSLQWNNLKAIVDGLYQNESAPAVIALRERIDRSVRRLPARTGVADIDSAVDCVVEAAELSRIVRRGGREQEVIDRARAAFDSCGQHHVKIQFLGLQVEANAYLGNTTCVMNGMRELELFAQPMDICVDTVVDALQNVGLAIEPKLETSIEYRHILGLLLEQSEERMLLAPPNPNLQWFHHVLSAFYRAYIGDSEGAQPHLDAANRRRPDDQGVKKLAGWERMLSRASRMI